MDRAAKPIPSTLHLALLLALLIPTSGCGGDGGSDPVDEAGGLDSGVPDSGRADDVYGTSSSPR